MSHDNESVQDAAEEVFNQFDEMDDVDVSVGGIREDIENQLEYQVPLEDAKHAARRNAMQENGVRPEDLFNSGSPDVDIADIDEELGDDEWVSVEGEVLETWEADHDSVIQSGLIGDDTGKTKFTAWASSFDEAPFEEGETVSLDPVVSDEYEGRYSINVNSRTDIETIDASFEVPDNNVVVEGALVDIRSGSGLIQRCPEDDCTRVIQNGRCSEHGEVDGEFDLRIKGTLDDGDSTQKVIFDEEMTEDVSGMSLEEAQDIAMDTLDQSAPGKRLHDELVGQYFRVEGPEFGENVLVDEVSEPESAGVDDLLVRARTMQAEVDAGSQAAEVAD